MRKAKHINWGQASLLGASVVMSLSILSTAAPAYAAPSDASSSKEVLTATADTDNAAVKPATLLQEASVLVDEALTEVAAEAGAGEVSTGTADAVKGSKSNSKGVAMSQALGDKTQTVFSLEQQVAIEKIIREYMLQHPEILVEAAQALEAKQYQVQQVALQGAINFFKQDKMVPVRGKRSAKHYLIEFYDVNCGYCKIVRPLIKELFEKNDIAIYYVEFPILSPLSVRAAALALALYQENPEQYLAYQETVMTSKERIETEEQLQNIFTAAGANFKKLDQKTKDNAEIQEALRKNMELGQAIGVQGTPFFILDGMVIRGAVKDYSVLEQIIKDNE